MMMMKSTNKTPAPLGDNRPDCQRSPSPIKQSRNLPLTERIRLCPGGGLMGGGGQRRRRKVAGDLISCKYALVPDSAQSSQPGRVASQPTSKTCRLACGTQILSEITANHLSPREAIPSNHPGRERHFIPRRCQDGKKLHSAIPPQLPTPKSLLSPVWSDRTTADKAGNERLSNPEHMSLSLHL